jgi:hypothetical protein
MPPLHFWPSGPRSTRNSKPHNRRARRNTTVAPSPPNWIDPKQADANFFAQRQLQQQQAAQAELQRAQQQLRQLQQNQQQPRR